MSAPSFDVRVLDSADRSDDVRRSLDIDRSTARRLGEEAVRFIEQGWYPAPDGRRVSWAEAVEKARSGTVSLPPEARLPSPPATAYEVTTVEVANETSLGAAHRLVAAGLRPLVLNLANGVHPGGGFLSGSRAQEESLCRSSALYATLTGDPMYAAHASRALPDSSDWVILSPDVPVFRDDGGGLLEAPWSASFVTSAAPYAPSIGQPTSGDLLDARIDRLLTVAWTHGYSALVLGAWGCGAFGNDADRTARDFRTRLEDRVGAFEHVVFAIADWSSERRFLGPFAAAFSA